MGTGDDNVMNRTIHILYSYFTSTTDEDGTLDNGFFSFFSFFSSTVHHCRMVSDVGDKTCLSEDVVADVVVTVAEILEALTVVGGLLWRL